MNNKFSKGSIWRKWDLHVHTPFSELNNEFGEDWDTYVQQLFKRAIENDVQAIGITDYYLIEGYKKLKREYLANEGKLAKLFTINEIEYIKQMLIFPNIEFRIDKLVIGKEIDPTWNRKVNFHLLLSDEILIEDIEENLLNNLKFEINGIGDGISQKNGLTKRNLQDLGKELQGQHPPFLDYSDLFVGMISAAISIDNLIDELKSKSKIFQGKYLFGLPADEDLSLVNWNSSGHLPRKVLIQKAHILLSANPNTVKFGLGKFADPDEASYIREFNALKPCLWGSDAHSFEKLFLPDEQRNTWIKADLTFEGLKTVIFEPEGRVKIQANKPESKPLYQVIDKVRILDESEKNTFSSSLIEFNENLTTIIGGKSSGKSLLLYHIARAIDPSQVDQKSQDSVSNYSKLRADSPFDVEVYWKDGTVNTLNISEEKNGQITYIPQLYINHLAEKGGKDELFSLIESILLQNKDYAEFKERTDIEKQTLKETIHRCIQELLRLTNAVDVKIKEIQLIGTQQQLTAEKERLYKQIQLLTKQSGLTEEQASRYSTLENEKRRYEAALNRAKERVSHYQKMNISFNGILNDIISTTKEKIDEFGIPEDTEYQILVKSESDKLISGINKSFAEFLQTISQQIEIQNQKIIEGQKKLDEIIKELQPFVKIAKNREILKEEQKKYSDIENKLITLKIKTDECQKLKEQGVKNNEKLFETYKYLFALYKATLIEIEKPEYSKIDNDLLLKPVLIFDKERFSSSFSGLFDKRGNFNQIFNQTFDDENQFIFNEQQHVGNIRTIFDKIRSRSETSLRIRVGMNEDEKYQRLFENYFRIEYTIEHKGDDMLRMSPGKRGLVLLQLILHISTATHPILIDQPEDNLDNRTIFFDLKDFIKHKKSHRQIILVTHNANLVVATDAECIIVANQDGQQLGKDNRKYKFEYVSGALENTFIKESNTGVLYQKGIKEHVCDILEGGKEAFLKREQKYGFTYLK